MKNRWDSLLKEIRFRPRSERGTLDARNHFDDDYNRIINSPSFRRLQDKTQVFPLEQSDFIRTRLTHSLETSSLARSIGLSLENELIKRDEMKSDHRGLLSSLLSTAGLVHDIGNPPFGHFGEESIQQFFKHNLKKIKEGGFSNEELADFENFEGNAQTFRILRKLCYLKDEHSLNLAYPTLASIIKYPRSSINGNKKDTGNIADKKFGYFVTEKEDFEMINKELEMLNERHPATFLLEAADDIAYMAADLEDGVRIGILNHDLISEILDSIKHSSNSIIKEKFSEYFELYKGMNHNRLDFTATRFKIDVQAHMTKGIILAFLNNYDKILKGEFKSDLMESSDVFEVRQAFKKLANKIHISKNITEAELLGCKVIKGLLKYFIKAAETECFSENNCNCKESKLYRMISSSYRLIYEKYAKYSNKQYNKFQLVLDHISGMTDSYALSLYRKLSGIQN